METCLKSLFDFPPFNSCSKIDLFKGVNFRLRLIFNHGYSAYSSKVEKVLKGSLNLIPPPLPLVNIQIMGGKVCLRCKGLTLLVVVNKLLKTKVTKSLLTSPSNVLPYYLQKPFPPIIWIFTESEGDGIKSRRSFEIFSTLKYWVKMLPTIFHCSASNNFFLPDLF